MIRKLPIKEFTANPNDTIWDVRENDAYQKMHLVGAVNKPISTLTKELLDSVADPVYVLCGGGSRAGKASIILDEFDNSRDIVILQGGTRGALANGVPVEGSEV